MNLTHKPMELKGAARFATTALSLVLIGGACTSALAFRQQVAAPQTQTTTAPSSVIIADASGPHPVVKVLTPPNAGTAQPQSGPGLHLSGNVVAGNRITFVEPVYPPEAKAANLSGIVILHAIIGKDGTIKELNVLSGPDQFRESALSAVRQWTYRPYLLNGNPVEVDTTITVNYTLNPQPAPEPSPTPNPSASNSRSSAMPNQAMPIGGDA